MLELSRSGAKICSTGDSKIVLSSADKPIVWLTDTVRSENDPPNASRTDTSAAPPIPSSRSPIVASKLSRTLTLTDPAVKLVDSPA